MNNKTQEQYEKQQSPAPQYPPMIGPYGPILPTSNMVATNESVPGESIERRVERIMNNQEPITDGAPIIYTERKDGVKAEYNIRTDRFDLALDMTDQITKTEIAKRQQRIAERETPKTEKPNESGTQQ